MTYIKPKDQNHEFSIDSNEFSQDESNESSIEISNVVHFGFLKDNNVYKDQELRHRQLLQNCSMDQDPPQTWNFDIEYQKNTYNLFIKYYIDTKAGSDNENMEDVAFHTALRSAATYAEKWLIINTAIANGNHECDIALRRMQNGEFLDGENQPCCRIS